MSFGFRSFSFMLCLDTLISFLIVDLDDIYCLDDI